MSLILIVSLLYLFERVYNEMGNKRVEKKLVIIGMDRSACTCMCKIYTYHFLQTTSLEIGKVRNGGQFYNTHESRDSLGKMKQMTGKFILSEASDIVNLGYSA